MTCRIVIACEMGGGWGHVLPFRAIAREFLRRGSSVSVLCCDARRAHQAFAGLDVAIEQSPAWKILKTGFSLNYAHCIWGNGYWDKERFREQFAWWTGRLQEQKPHFVLTDYSPTALLAALSLDLPRGALGTGFTLPPDESPMPGLHPWLSLPEKELARTEEMLVERVRGAVPTVDSVARMFRGAKRFLTIFPETDHYENREGETFRGPIFESGSDAGCDWPEGDGPRVFFYLSSANRCLPDLLDHLRTRGLPAVGYVRDLPEADRHKAESPTLRISPRPLDIFRATAQCGVAVTHGGYSTTAQVLLMGVRMLVCPEQLEQTIQAHRLSAQGLCQFASFLGRPGGVREKFDLAAGSAELGRNAAAFAARHAGYDSSRTVREIVGECLEAAA